MQGRLKNLIGIKNDENIDGWIHGVGATTPADDTHGYLKGAIFSNTTDGYVYRNSGDKDGCAFVKLADAS